jgi:ribonuclease P protein component
VKRRFRLKDSADLKRVRRTGKSFAHPLVVLQVLKGSNNNDLQIGIIASRAIGNAVKRNYAKRLLREAVRSHLEEIHPGYDLVFVARKAILGSSFAELKSSILQLLHQAKLLKGQDDQRTAFRS